MILFLSFLAVCAALVGIYINNIPVFLAACGLALVLGIVNKFAWRARSERVRADLMDGKQIIRRGGRNGRNILDLS